MVVAARRFARVAVLIVVLLPELLRANCEIWDPAQISDRQFWDAIKETNNVDPSNPDWVKQLPMFRNFDKDKVQIRPTTKGGGGVIKAAFEVLVNGEPKYFIKRARLDKEAENSFKISQTAIVDPACLVDRSKEKKNLAVFEVKDVADVPHFAKTLAIHYVDDRTCDALMELAPGLQGFKIPDTDKQSQRDIGKKVALLHAFGYVHGDLTKWNFFYDAKSKTLTLIDFSTLRETHDEDEQLKDLLLLRGEPESSGNLGIVYNPYRQISEKLRDWFPKGGPKKYAPEQFIGAIEEAPLKPGFEVFDRFERSFSSLYENLVGYVQMLPETRRSKFSKRIPEYPDGPMSSIRIRFNVLNRELKEVAGLSDEQVAKFWSRFPSIPRMVKGDFEKH